MNANDGEVGVETAAADASGMMMHSAGSALNSKMMSKLRIITCLSVISVN